MAFPGTRGCAQMGLQLQQCVPIPVQGKLGCLDSLSVSDGY